jgi:hypothetical protein
MAVVPKTVRDPRAAEMTRADNSSEDENEVEGAAAEDADEDGDTLENDTDADAEADRAGRAASVAPSVGEPRSVLVREAAFTGEKPESIDDESRTADVVMSTGAAVKRSDWRDGDYLEVLDTTSKAIRTGRLNAGGPLLDSHNYWGGTRSILGAVVPGSVRVERGTLRGKVKFSRSEEGERAFQDVKDGILRAVSVGYLTHKYETDDTTSPPTRRATDWEPYELSAVAMPADAAAGFRSAHRTHAAPAAPDASATSLARAAMRMKQRRAAV